MLVLAWMAAAMALPITTMRARSCAGPDLPQAVGRAGVAFVGAVWLARNRA